MMRFDEIKTREEFMEYMNQKMLNEGKSDGVSIDECRKKCKELGISESVLRMHIDMHR